MATPETTEIIPIDEKYTFKMQGGHVQILRGGEAWLGQEPGGFAGSKAWVSAAYLIQEQREHIARLEAQLAERK